MRYFSLIVLPILVPLLAKSQPVEINISILQCFSSQAKLFLYNGSNAELIDSSFQAEPGTYKFSLKADHQKGLYRVDVGKNISFDLIVNGEPEIDVYSVVFAPNDSLKSTKSAENQVFWNYQKTKKRNEQHTWLIRSLMDYYPDSTMLREMLESELFKQNIDLYNFAKDLQAAHPQLLSSKLIILDQRPIAPPELTGEEKREFQIESWWDGIDLNESLLANTPVFSSRLWGFIELIFSDSYDKEEQDAAFIKGITSLMSKQVCDSVRYSIREILIDGFKESDYTLVVDFLETETFSGLTPLKEKTEKIKNNQTGVQVGQKAYDFIIEQPSGKKVKLSKLNSKYKLVIFWSSWCPHCLETLPRIADVYNSFKDKGLEIIAISIDDEDNLWQGYINKLNLSWINMREPYSLDSKLLNKYQVEETPKMLLLSKDLTILSCPSTKKQLEVKLKKLIGVQ